MPVPLIRFALHGRRDWGVIAEITLPDCDCPQCEVLAP
jgi:hypothetical protein